MKKVLLYLAGVAVFIAVIGILTTRNQNGDFSLKSTPSPTSEKKEIKVAEYHISVEVADSDEERRRGLSKRDSLPEGEGMLFVFEENSRPSFWMKDMNFAVDIIWIDDGQIVGIENSVQPEPEKEVDELTLYPAPQEIDYVLEVNANYTEEKGMAKGDSVEINLN